MALKYYVLISYFHLAEKYSVSKIPKHYKLLGLSRPFFNPNKKLHHQKTIVYLKNLNR